MHLLYLDDSGTIGDPQTAHCLFAGFAIFETVTHWVEQDINAVAAKYRLPPSLEFHATHINTGKNAWRKISKDVRQEILFDLYTLIKNRGRDIHLFASVHNIEKSRQRGTT